MGVAAKKPLVLNLWLLSNTKYSRPVEKRWHDKPVHMCVFVYERVKERERETSKREVGNAGKAHKSSLCVNTKIRWRIKQDLMKNKP